MDLGLTGKTVLVTGGSKGIGLAIARSFAAEGAHVTIAARDPQALEQARDALAAEQLGIKTLAVDLATDAGRERLHADAAQTDILVNNAGAIKGGSLSSLSLDDWREGWELKVFGYVHLCKLFYPDMKQRGSGAIINIIGMAGRAPRPDYICGATANAGLIAFTNALGADAARHGVRVLGINPSPTETDRIRAVMMSRAEERFQDKSRWQEVLNAADLPYGRLKTPAEVAALTVMLASDRVEYLSGTVIDMDGGGQWRG